MQVGHSVTIGEDTVIAGQVGIAGSTRIGNRVTLAGQVGVAGHLTIEDGVIATAQTGIPGLVEKGSVDLGLPRDREPRVAQVERGLRPVARAAEAAAGAGAEGRVAARPAALRLKPGYFFLAGFGGSSFGAS